MPKNYPNINVILIIAQFLLDDSFVKLQQISALSIGLITNWSALMKGMTDFHS